MSRSWEIFLNDEPRPQPSDPAPVPVAPAAPLVAPRRRLESLVSNPAVMFAEGLGTLGKAAIGSKTAAFVKLPCFTC